jgi:CheY-like chemotaxis protein
VRTRAFRCSTTARDPTCPVILTFAKVERRDLLETLSAGAEGVLRYPLSVASVRGVLEAVTTHRREFVRSKAYIEPCRRRGLATQDDGKKRREEDAPGVSQLNIVLAAMEQIHADARGPEGVSVSRADILTTALQDYFVAIRPDKKAGMNVRCEVVTAQFVELARAQPDFEAAAAPLRRVLSHAALAQRASA